VQCFSDESTGQYISEQILQLPFEILWVYTVKVAIAKNNTNTLGSLKYFDEQVEQSFNLANTVSVLETQNK
jgi:hypothetical protein